MDPGVPGKVHKCRADLVRGVAAGIYKYIGGGGDGWRVDG